MTHEEMLLKNETIMLSFFTMLSISRVAVDFEGSGDSGSINNIYIQSPSDQDLKNTKVEFYDSKKVFNNGWVEEIGTVQGTLEDLIQAQVYRYLEDTDVDWYNNDGGYGQWIWESPNRAEFYVAVRVTEVFIEHSEDRQLTKREDSE